MKKIVALLLTMIICLSMVACGNNSNANTLTNDSSATNDNIATNDISENYYRSKYIGEWHCGATNLTINKGGVGLFGTYDVLWEVNDGALAITSEFFNGYSYIAGFELSEDGQSLIVIQNGFPGDISKLDKGEKFTK